MRRVDQPDGIASERATHVFGEASWTLRSGIQA
jgi:hypothetical protein